MPDSSQASLSNQQSSADVATPPTTGSEVANTSPDNGQPNDAQPPAATQPQRPRSSFVETIKNVMFQMMVVWLISKYLMPGQRGSTTTPTTGTDPVSGKNIARGKAVQNLFGEGFSMDLYVYVSEDNYEPDFFDPSELKWIQKNIIYYDWTQGPDKDSIFQTDFQVDLSHKVQRNSSLWLHAYFVKSGFIPFEETRTAENFSPIYTLHKKKRLNRYMRKRYKDTHNLITGKTDKTVEEQEKIKKKINEEVISHWHPNLTINMVYDHTAWTPGAVPSPLNEHVDFEPTTSKYYPIVYMNDYWNLLRDYQPINETVKQIQLSISYQPISMMKWQLYAAQTMRKQWTSILGSEGLENEDEQDHIKETLLETSPILLAMTVVVTMAHCIFEFLAFKNDIQFWKDRKSVEGLSVRSVFFNLFQSVVVLLYVLDNDTNTMIRVSIGIGLLIELWKIPKVMDVKIDRTRKFLYIFPRVSFLDKGSYVASSTKEYDMMAYRYLSWLMFPLFIGYGVYSLVYQEHKGWYSFILNMTYGFLLAFGFIMMTPQLFINYKLKSVAHLPWRMLSYKFLNTFIDDIFAFIIKTPLMYRLGCFRDDIIFIIYLYQRWIYRVDPKRVNEFGISGDDMKGNPPAEQEQLQIQGSEAVTEEKKPESNKQNVKITKASGKKSRESKKNV